MTGGRIQEITLHNCKGEGKNIPADITDSKDGKVLRTESTPTPRPWIVISWSPRSPGRSLPCTFRIMIFVNML